MPVAFSWHSCCEEVILARCLMLLENTVLKMPGYALKVTSILGSRLKGELCSCFLNVSVQIELQLQE